MTQAHSNVTLNLIIHSMPCSKTSFPPKDAHSSEGLLGNTVISKETCDLRCETIFSSHEKEAHCEKVLYYSSTYLKVRRFRMEKGREAVSYVTVLQLSVLTPLKWASLALTKEADTLYMLLSYTFSIHSET